MTFLIVDDNQRFRQSVVRYILTNIPDHHTVHEAANGLEAVEQYEQTHPDWVLMDIAMEPMDGLTSSRTILEAHPEAKIVILTSYDNDRYRDVARKAGTKGFVMKERLVDLITILSPRAA